MILQIVLQKAIAGIVGNVVTGFTNPSGGTGTTGEVLKGNGGGGDFASGSAWDESFANGGIMSKYGAMPLKKYANGGIAHKPQVALFGEGDTPEAYVPLPDGRTIPVTLEDSKASASQMAAPAISVNVINQGQPAEAEQGDSRFDGEGYILDVVMRNANKPGPLRDTLKGGR